MGLIDELLMYITYKIYVTLNTHFYPLLFLQYSELDGIWRTKIYLKANRKWRIIYQSAYESTWEDDTMEYPLYITIFSNPIQVQGRRFFWETGIKMDLVILAENLKRLMISG